MAMFRNRTAAGHSLAQELVTHPALQEVQDVVVLGLPRGGVPVAAEVARVLGAEMDVLVVRKLGVPFHPELAMGAVGEEGILVLKDDIVAQAEASQAELAAVIARQRDEVEARAIRFRPGRSAPVSLDGRIALIVDDGVATGATAQAAATLARKREATMVVLATPVAPYGVVQAMESSGIFDVIICRSSPASFRSVGSSYADFTQVTDEEVRRILGA